MMKKKYLCFFIAIFIFFSGCCIYERGQNTEISYKQNLMDDHEYLWLVLQEEYPFMPVLEADGIDIKGIYEKGIEKIEKEIDSVEEFIVLLKQEFSQMKNFAHLDLVDNALYTYVIEKGEGFSSHQKGRYRVFSSIQDKKIYNLTNEKAISLPEVEVRKFEELKTVYFRFPTFQAVAIERDINCIYDSIK